MSELFRRDELRNVQTEQRRSATVLPSGPSAHDKLWALTLGRHGLKYGTSVRGYHPIVIRGKILEKVEPANSPMTRLTITKWNEAEQRRTAVGKKILGKLDRSQVLLADAHILFLDGVLSFQSEAFTATVVMCRASAETALYLLMTRGPSEYHGEPVVVIDYSCIQDRFPILLRKAWSRRMIDYRLVVVFEHLIRIGNLGAHLGSIADKRIEKGLRWSVEESDAEGALRGAVRILNALSSRFSKINASIQIRAEPMKIPSS